jgi:hypothetical protein
MAEMITTDTHPQTQIQQPAENIIPKCEEECDDEEGEEECDDEEGEEECDDEEGEEECDEEECDDEDDEEECDEEEEDEEECDEEDEEEDYEFKDIYFVILQNKPDYNNDFPNKTIWNKNMKAYVHTYLQNNQFVSYKELIKVPKYIIDAPFETPSETTADYNEEDYDIITEDVDVDADVDESEEPTDGSEPGQEGVSDDNYYIIRIHKITILVNDENDLDLEKLRRDRQAYEDFEAGDELGNNIRDGVSCIASTCTKIVLVTYVLAFFVGIMPLVLSEKNNVNNQHQQWCSDHMYCSKY